MVAMIAMTIRYQIFQIKRYYPTTITMSQGTLITYPDVIALAVVVTLVIKMQFHSKTPKHHTKDSTKKTAKKGIRPMLT